MTVFFFVGSSITKPACFRREKAVSQVFPAVRRKSGEERSSFGKKHPACRREKNSWPVIAPFTMSKKYTMDPIKLQRQLSALAEKENSLQFENLMLQKDLVQIESDRIIEQVKRATTRDAPATTAMPSSRRCCHPCRPALAFGASAAREASSSCALVSPCSWLVRMNMRASQSEYTHLILAVVASLSSKHSLFAHLCIMVACMWIRTCAPTGRVHARNCRAGGQDDPP